jgi:hypothetical protein
VSVKLWKLDGTELELTDRPIPRMVSIEYNISPALSEGSDRDTFEAAVSLLDEDDVAYSIDVDVELLPSFNISKALNYDELSFTTMTERDINGDGHPDVAVGAIGYPAIIGKGRIYIFLGTAGGIESCDLENLLCVPDAIITGETDGEWFGAPLTVGGDINGDGYADLVAGNQGFDNNRGRALIFLGSEDGIDSCDLSPDCTAHATIFGNSPGDSFSNKVPVLDDLNGDGYDDLGFAAPYADSDRGKVYIFNGGPDISGNLSAESDADIIFRGENPGDVMTSIQSIGDVNGDGHEDIMLSACSYGNYNGRTYLLLGSAEGFSNCDLWNGCEPDAVITGAGDRNHLCLTPKVGDINGDGFDDLLVEAMGADWLNIMGHVYLFYGSASGIRDCDMRTGCTADTTLTGENDRDIFGLFSYGGDLNGDGYGDIVVPARLYEDFSIHGRAYIFLGSETGIDDCDLSTGCTADSTITGEHDLDKLGTDVLLMDTNSDGYDDLLISVPGYQAGAYTGRVYIFLGSEAGIESCVLPDCNVDAILAGESGWDIFGSLR